MMHSRLLSNFAPYGAFSFVITFISPPNRPTQHQQNVVREPDGEVMDDGKKG